MIVTKTKGRRFLCLLTGALLTGLTLVFPTVGFLEWITLIPVGIFLLDYASRSETRLRHLYGYGLLFFWSFYLVVFHWFINLYPLDFIDGMTKGGAISVVLVAWLGLSLLQALMGGLLFVAAGLLLRVRLARRIPMLRPFLVAGLWAVYEWTQTLGWWGVPWGRLPIGQSKYLVGLQTASWFGSYFVTFLLVAVNLCLAYAVCEMLRHPKKEWWGASKGACLAVVVLLVFQYGAGTILWLCHPAVTDTTRAAAIQGNISSHEKWSFDSTQRTKEIYREYTLKAAKAGAEIVVWPETALPYVVDGETTYLTDLAMEADVTILVGAFTEEKESNQEYNSIACFLPDGTMHETVYSKRRLVPFGEFVPLRGLIETLIPPLAELVLSGDDVAWGEETSIWHLEEGSVGALICFDSIYEDLTRDSVRDGAELICLSTNDSWFTDSAALYMHNAQAQLRAIENGRYVVRAANTGISTIISDRGEVLAQLEPLVDGMLVEDVAIRDSLTLYSRIGNWFVYGWMFFAAGLLLAECVILTREKRKRQEKTLDRA